MIDAARLLLEHANDRARGVRETADAINTKAWWLVAYLGVLLVAVGADLDAAAAHRATRVSLSIVM